MTLRILRIGKVFAPFVAFLLFWLAGARPVFAASPWLSVSSGHFTLYTTGRSAEAVPLLKRLEIARVFFVQSGYFTANRSRPLDIIAFSNAEEYAAYQAKPGVAAFFQPGRQNDFIVLGSLAPEYGRIVVHEYVHSVFSQALPQLPLWLQEGLADVYSTLELEKDSEGSIFRIGALLPERASDRNTLGTADLASLFSVGKSSPIYADGEAGWRFYSQSWALAHMLVVSDRYSPRLPAFLADLSAGASATDAFKRIYGATLEQVSSDLRSYWGQSTTAIKIVKCQDETASESLTAATSKEERSASAIELMLANLLATNRDKQQSAEALLTTLSLQYSDEPRIEESLAYLLLSQQRVEEAKIHMARAVRLRSNDADLIFRYAVMEENAGSPDTEILALLKRSLEFEPENNTARLAVASREARSGAFQAAIDTLATPLKNPTRSDSYVTSYTLAFCHIQLANWQLGRSYAAAALRNAENTEEQKNANGLLSYVERRIQPQEQTQSRVRTLSEN